MAFDVEMPSEVSVYHERWQRLLDHVHAGIPLHEQVREAIDSWGKQATTPENPETDPAKRYEQVQRRVAALSAHFAPVIGVVTVWAEGLKPLLATCAASLDGLPLFSAADGVMMAFSRASNVRLDRRSRWLREVAEIMQRVEGGPREIGAALRALEEVLARFNHELDSARGTGRKGNVSCLRWLIPTHPALGAPPVRTSPAQPKDELEWLYR